jgi:hypothetical protein
MSLMGHRWHKNKLQKRGAEKYLDHGVHGEHRVVMKAKRRVERWISVSKKIE